MKSIWNVVLMGEFCCRTIEVDADMDFFQVLRHAEVLFGPENVVTVEFDHNVEIVYR